VSQDNETWRTKCIFYRKLGILLIFLLITSNERHLLLPRNLQRHLHANLHLRPISRFYSKPNWHSRIIIPQLNWAILYARNITEIFGTAAINCQILQWNGLNHEGWIYLSICTMSCSGTLKSIWYIWQKYVRLVWPYSVNSPKGLFSSVEKGKQLGWNRIRRKQNRPFERRYGYSDF